MFLERTGAQPLRYWLALAAGVGLVLGMSTDPVPNVDAIDDYIQRTVLHGWRDRPRLGWVAAFSIVFKSVMPQ